MAEKKWLLVPLVVVVGGFLLVWKSRFEWFPAAATRPTRMVKIPLAHPKNPDTISVMTANIALDTPTEAQYPWAKRRALVARVLLKYHADIIGTQASSPVQTAYLSHYLTAYLHYPTHAHWGVNVFASLSGALETWNQIWFKADRFALVAAAHGLVRPHHLQANPTENTYYSLVVLRDRLGILPDTIVIDTHLRHGNYNAALCARKLHRILARWKKRFPHAPAMLMGDMNHPKSDAAVYTALCGHSGPGLPPGTRLKDTFDYQARPKGVLWGTWQQFKGQPVIALPSDLILVSPTWRFTPAKILRDHTSAGLYPSDHYFVMSDLTWPGGPRSTP